MIKSARRALTSAPTLRLRLARDTVVSGVLQIAQMMLGLAASILLARFLGVDGYGAYSYAVGVVSLTSIVACAGLPPLLVRNVAAYDQSGKTALLNGVARRSQQLAVLFALLMMIGVLVFAVWHAGWKPGDQWTLLVVASVAIPFATLISVKSSILLGLRNVIQSKIPGAIVRPSSFLIFVAVLYWSGALTPVSAIVFYVVSVAFAFSVSRMLVSRCAGAWVEPSEYDDRRWRASLLPFSGIALIGALNNEVFIPLLGIMANNEEVAYFRVALSLAITTSLPLKIVESVIYPHVSRLYMSGETKRIFRMVFFAGVSSVVLCMPAAAAFIFYGMEIIDLIYGQSYAGAYYPLLTLVVGFTFVSVVGPSMQLLHATEFERDAMVISVVSLLLLLILSATLIPDHGAFGAALAFAIAKGARAVAFRAWAGVRVK